MFRKAGGDAQHRSGFDEKKTAPPKGAVSFQDLAIAKRFLMRLRFKLLLWKLMRAPIFDS